MPDADSEPQLIVRYAHGVVLPWTQQLQDIYISFHSFSNKKSLIINAI